VFSSGTPQTSASLLNFRKLYPPLPLTKAVSVSYIRKHVHNGEMFFESTGQSQNGFKL
jgi:hypothetical protein